MDGITFVLTVAMAWVGWKLGHDGGKMVGRDEGRKEGYKIGLVEGVRVTSLALKNPEALRQEIRANRILDGDLSALNEIEESLDTPLDGTTDSEFLYVQRLSDHRLIPVNDGLILMQQDNLMVVEVPPEEYARQHPLELHDSGSKFGMIKFFKVA